MEADELNNVLLLSEKTRPFFLKENVFFLIWMKRNELSLTPIYVKKVVILIYFWLKNTCIRVYVKLH